MIKLSIQLTQNAKVLVGFSGGADSTALLHLLVTKLGAERVVSLHIHHGIRGQEADEDAAFAASFAASLGVTHYSEAISVPHLVSLSGKSLEEAARDARYSLFLSYARKADCNYIALAHHRNDLVETFLFNLSRGSSAGHASIPACRSLAEITVVRPLINSTRMEIEAYLKQNNLLYRIDSSNLTDSCSRNIIRHHVIPFLEQVNSAALSHISSSVERLQEDESFLSSLAQEEYSRRAHDNCLHTNGLFSLSPSLWNRVLYLYLSRPALPFSASLCQRVQALFSDGASPSGMLDIGGGWRVCRRYDELIVTQASEPASFVPFSISLSSDGLYCLNELYSLLVTHTPAPLPQARFLNAVYIEPTEANALVRPRKSQDELIFPYGKKTLKRLFIERKIPKSVRACLPVVEIGGTVACVPCAGSSLPFYVKGDKAICFQLINNNGG